MKNKMFCVVAAAILSIVVAVPVFAEEPYEGIIGIYWDQWEEVEGDPADVIINQCIMEVRQDGVVFDMESLSVVGCIPNESGPLIGQCGEDLIFDLMIPDGESKVWARCVWIRNGVEITFLKPDPLTEVDDDHFYLWDTVLTPYSLILPMIFKNATSF